MLRFASLATVVMLAASFASGRALARSGDAYLVQVSWSNEARGFVGLGQFALHTNEAREMYGLAQVGLWNTSRWFGGLLQLGVQNRVKRLFFGVAQVGAHNYQRTGFVGVGQLGGLNEAERDFYGLFQAGVINIGEREFYALAQIGAWNEAGGFIGALQLGIVNRKAESGDFMGPAQIGLVNTVEHSFASSWLGQIGLVNYVPENPLYAPLQVGALNVAVRFFGLAQIAAFNFTEKSRVLFQAGLLNHEELHIKFAQIGVVNMARRITGVQIGLWNHAGWLEGLQIGLVNTSGRGGLPFFPIANAAF
jgi:hypothetical protein